MMLCFSMLQCVAVCCSVLQSVPSDEVCLILTVYCCVPSDVVFQYVAVCCSVLQCVPPDEVCLISLSALSPSKVPCVISNKPYLNKRYAAVCPLLLSATHCNALQHTATHYNTLHHATTLQRTATQQFTVRCCVPSLVVSLISLSARSLATRYNTATHCNTQQLTVCCCVPSLVACLISLSALSLSKPSLCYCLPYILSKEPCVKSNEL